MIIKLKIDSWIGISPGAIHYYGRLRTEKYTGSGYKELLHSWTAASAKRANENDAWLYPGVEIPTKAKAGELTRCFDSRDEVIAFAVKEYKSIFPEATQLELDTAIVEDQKVLDP